MRRTILLACLAWFAACGDIDAPDEDTTTTAGAYLESGDGGGSGSGTGSYDAPANDAPPGDAPASDAPASDAPPGDAAADAGTDAPADAAADAPADAPVDAGCVAQEEPQCADAPDGVEPVDPGNAAGSLCRGACGADCPATCVAGTPITECHEWQTADCRWHAKVCTYPTRSCGSHAACRTHDTCYDDCAGALFPVLCRRACDNDCVQIHGLAQCTRWAGGNGPYDQWNTYADEPSEYTYDSTCY